MGIETEAEQQLLDAAIAHGVERQREDMEENPQRRGIVAPGVTPAELNMQVTGDPITAFAYAFDDPVGRLRELYVDGTLGDDAFESFLGRVFEIRPELIDVA